MADIERRVQEMKQGSQEIGMTLDPNGISSPKQPPPTPGRRRPPTPLRRRLDVHDDAAVVAAPPPTLPPPPAMAVDDSGNARSPRPGRGGHHRRPGACRLTDGPRESRAATAPPRAADGRINRAKVAARRQRALLVARRAAVRGDQNGAVTVLRRGHALSEERQGAGRAWQQEAFIEWATRPNAARRRSSPRTTRRRPRRGWRDRSWQSFDRTARRPWAIRPHPCG